MIHNQDVSKIISELVCINSYHLHLSLALTSKGFYNLVKEFIIEKLFKPEIIFMATYIKNWRGVDTSISKNYNLINLTIF